MKIYTKTGDLGQTSLLGGARVDKNNPRVEAYGSVDELNSWVGLLRDQEIESKESQLSNPAVLKIIQETLFIIGSHLAKEPADSSENSSSNAAVNKLIPELTSLDIEILENAIDEMELNLEPLRHFILPGGHASVSYVHIARSVCRRSERLVVGLHDDGSQPYFILIYLNRLSDFFFVLARYWTFILGVPEYKWIPNPRK